jgi:hypothetical protein
MESIISLVIGTILVFLLIFQIIQKKIGKIPVIALDSNVLIGWFLYRHPEYTKDISYFDLECAKYDNKVIEWIEKKEVRGFVPREWVRQAAYALEEKYKLPKDIVREFEKEVFSKITTSSKRKSPFDEKMIKSISENFVHRKDQLLVEEALRGYCDAIVTNDKRFVKNPSLLRYIPVLYVEDFVKAVEEGKTTRKQFQKEAEKKSIH